MAENLINLTDANFEQEVINSDIPVLVDFWAEWCAPCKMIAPTISEIAKDYSGKIKVGKLDVDGNHITAAKYGIRSIPTLLIFNEGKLIDGIIGAVPKKHIVSKIDNILSKKENS